LKLGPPEDEEGVLTTQQRRFVSLRVNP
jgi:hypothetical protein